jgi:predicted MFS family arabinose efflux permease
MAYPVMLAIGAGGVIDMTSRRALIYDIVGEERVTNAFALESLSMSIGNMLGAILGGAMITLLGIGPAFLLIALCYAGAFAFLFSMPSPSKAHRQSGAANFLTELRSGIAYVRRDRPLVSILGVTVLVNLFFFSFMPMVPVFADRMGVNALLTGILASGSGIGMVLGSLAIAARQPQRRGRVYVGGSFLALSFLACFAAVPWYPAALLALVIAGIGTAGFGAMQGVLVMVAAGAEMRGRAMGLLSMAIGGLPFGMVLLGLAAQGLGPPVAVVLSVCLGLMTMAAWLRRRPEAARIA